MASSWSQTPSATMLAWAGLRTGGRAWRLGGMGGKGQEDDKEQCFPAPDPGLLSLCILQPTEPSRESIRSWLSATRGTTAALWQSC